MSTPNPVPIDPNSLNGQLMVGATSQPNVPPPTQQDVSQPPNMGPSAPQVPLPPRPVGTAAAAQPPPSKADFFRQLLGNFFYAAGTGLAASGHGPGSAERGAGAALTALPNREILNQQLEVAREQARGMAAYHQAQAQALQTGSQQIQVPIFGPDGKVMTNPDGSIQTQPILQKDLGNYFGRTGAAGMRLAGVQDTNVTRQNISTEQTGAKKEIAGEQIASKEKLAANALEEKRNEFYDSQAYKKWKTNADNATKERVASLQQSKAPAAVMQSAIFANSGLGRLQDMDTSMESLEKSGVMGSLPKNWIENWVFGKGAVDPTLPPSVRRTIGQLRSAAELTSSATMRAHTGRTSREIYDDFKQMLGPGQDWNALRGAMDETKSTLQDYSQGASDANIRAIRTGGAPTKTADPVQSLIDKYKPK